MLSSRRRRNAFLYRDRSLRLVDLVRAGVRIFFARTDGFQLFEVEVGAWFDPEVDDRLGNRCVRVVRRSSHDFDHRLSP